MELVRATPFNFGYVVAQLRPPADSMTVVVKATFALVPEGVCTALEEQPLCDGEVHFDDDETASLQRDTDLAPFKPHGECTLAGSCFAPGGKPVPALPISFRVGTVKKTLAVFGDRYWKRATLAGMSDPEPFATMPLRYERSYGGPGYPKNPVGRGYYEKSGDTAKKLLPNIEDTRSLVVSPDVRPTPVGSFPIPRGWAHRMAKVGTYNNRWLKTRWPGFPEDFDFTYFNSAPDDQQISGYFRGDEEIELQNLHPQHPVVRTRLPGIRARCFLEPAMGVTDPFREVALQLDTIAIDTDKATVTCLWRGITPVSSVKMREIGRVFILHEPIESRHPIEHYRAALTAQIEVVAREDDDPNELPPTEIETLVAAPKPAAPPPAAVNEATEEVFAKLRAMGIDPEEVPEAKPPPDPVELAEKLRASFEAMGANAPEEAAEILAALTAPMPTRRPAEPAALPRNLREEVRARHARGESLARMDLTATDLSAMDLRGADFSGAVFTRANLRGTVFESANLESAILSLADCSGANFVSARLGRADLSGAVAMRADFAGADLGDSVGSNCNAPGARFEGAKLEGASFVEADLTACNFVNAVLKGADFSGSTLRDSVFTGAVLAGAVMYTVLAERVNMEGCDLTKLRASDNSNFTGARFQKVKANGSLWSGSILDGADFSFAELDRADFSAASLLQTLLIGCKIREGKFQEARLVGARLMQSDVFKGTFESADLTNADLRGSNFYAAEFWRATIQNTRLELADLTMTKLA